MTSPFPGMDPYIEACRLWDDFHFSLMGEIKTALAEVVPGHYVVRQGERAYISQMRPETLATERSQMQGDVSISLSLGRSSGDSDSSVAVLDQPLAAVAAESVSMVALEQVEFREPFREVVQTKVDQGLSAQRIYQDLVSDHGYGGKYPSVRRYVHRLTAGQDLPFRRMECRPGEEAQVDFGQGAFIEEAGRRRRPHVFRTSSASS